MPGTSPSTSPSPARPTGRRTARGDVGASAVEYAIILAGVAVVLGAAVGGLQASVGTVYRATTADIAGVATPSATPPAAGGGGGGSAPAPGPSTTTPAPGPSTTTPAPSSTTPTPATSSTTPAANPSTPSSTPSATAPAGSIPATPGSPAAPQTVPNWSNGAKDLDIDVDPKSAGSASIVSGKLVFIPAVGGPKGAVTVSWEFSKGSTDYEGSVVYWVS
jgi:Flp pilus assembly pilin Flp